MAQGGSTLNPLSSRHKVELRYYGVTTLCDTIDYSLWQGKFCEKKMLAPKHSQKEWLQRLVGHQELLVGPIVNVLRCSHLSNSHEF